MKVLISSTLLWMAVKVMAAQSTVNKIEVCYSREKYTLDVWEENVRQVVEFLFRSTCSETNNSEPFDAVRQCLRTKGSSTSLRFETQILMDQSPTGVEYQIMACSLAKAWPYCHDYTQGAKENFTCPVGFANHLLPVVNNFGNVANEFMCNDWGKNAIALGASEGDNCFFSNLIPHVRCAYRALSMVKNRFANESTWTMKPACFAMDVYRQCGEAFYSKCQTGIANALFRELFAKLKDNLHCPSEAGANRLSRQLVDSVIQSN